MATLYLITFAYLLISKIRRQIAFVRKNYKENTEELKHLHIETIKNKGYCLHADVEKIYVERIKTATEIKDEITFEETAKTEREIKDIIIPEETSQSQEISQNNSIWKVLRWFLLVIVIGLIFGLYYFWEKEEPLKIKKADIVLNLNIEKWIPFTKEQQKGKDKQFKAVIKNEYELEKNAEVNSFDVRFGLTTEALPPELDNFNNYPRLDGASTEDITNEFKKCNEKIEAYQWFRFDISKENISSQFNRSYNLNAFNSHNNPETENHIQVIYYPTQNLTVKVIFPENKPFIPNQVTYSKRQICDDVFQAQNPPKLTNPDKTVPEFVIEDPTGKEIIWHITNPELHGMYEIKWNW